AGANEEQGLVVTGLEDLAEAILRCPQWDLLVVHGQAMVRREIGHDLPQDVRSFRVVVRLERQVYVHAALGHWQCRHEDDEQHEEDVDQGRDVHVRRGGHGLPRDDLLGAVVLVRHGYSPWGRWLGGSSVMSATDSILAARSASIIFMM